MPPSDLDHPRLLRAPEQRQIAAAGGIPHEIYRRSRHSGRDQQKLTSLRRQALEPVQDQARKSFGHRQRVALTQRSPNFNQRPCSLKRKERIAARILRDVPQCRPREDVAEVRSNHMVQSAEAQGSQLDTLDSPSERSVKPEGIVGYMVLCA